MVATAAWASAYPTFDNCPTRLLELHGPALAYLESWSAVGKAAMV
jgi:hypothetical protein